MKNCNAKSAFGTRCQRPKGHKGDHYCEGTVPLPFKDKWPQRAPTPPTERGEG